MNNLTYISGRNGFIGGEISKTLESSGYTIIKDDFKLSEIGLLESMLPGLIIHCAAKVGRQNCTQDPQGAILDNVLGTYLISQVARKCKSKFVYTSSIAVYEFPHEVNYIHEDLPTIPESYYGMTKLMGETAVLGSLESSIIVRLGFVYGNPEYDKYSLVSSLIRGARVPYVGNYEKDYIHVNDVCEIIKRLILGNNSGIYNIGSGRSYNASEIVEFLRPGGELLLDSSDTFKSFVISTNKVCSKTGFKPTTDFWESLRELKKGYDEKQNI